MVRRSDLNAFSKAIKENPLNVFGNLFHASNFFMPLIIDLGVLHHMISDSNLISNVKLAVGNLLIAN